MNFEVLKVIILACQVSAGGDSGFRFSWIDVDKYQKRCQQELIQCYEVEVTKGGKPYAVRNCLMKR